MSDGWRFEERAGTPGELHASWPSVGGDPGTRAVARCRPTRTAVVLGSTQRSDVVGPGGGGLDVVRRRSGGGAVLVSPDDPVWIDVWVPVGDPLWTADVSRAFDWLGGTWGRALRALGLTGVVVRTDGPGACSRWSSLVCFGGVGAGEVTIAGRKAVGLAQRRDRRGAWFHGACVVRWDPSGLLAALALDDDERSAAADELADVVTGVADAATAQGVPTVPTAEAVVGAFVDALPRVRHALP